MQTICAFYRTRSEQETYDYYETNCKLIKRNYSFQYSFQVLFYSCSPFSYKQKVLENWPIKFDELLPPYMLENKEKCTFVE